MAIPYGRDYWAGLAIAGTASVAFGWNVLGPIFDGWTHPDAPPVSTVVTVPGPVRTVIREVPVSAPVPTSQKVQVRRETVAQTVADVQHRSEPTGRPRARTRRTATTPDRDQVQTETIQHVAPVTRPTPSRVPTTRPEPTCIDNLVGGDIITTCTTNEETP